MNNLHVYDQLLLVRPSDQLHQIFKKNSIAMTRKLDDMIELPKSLPKRTYDEDFESEIVMVKMPKCMAWLDDEPIGDLDTMEDKAKNPRPQSILHVLLSFEAYTPPVTHLEEVEETIGIPMEKTPTSTILDQTIANLKTQLVEKEVVKVKIPKYMAWLDDEPVGDLNTIEDKVDNLSPQITPQFFLSFEVYTPPVTYLEEVDETIGIQIEVERLNPTKLEDLGLNTYNHDIPLSFREIPSVDEPEPQLLSNLSPFDVNLGDKRGTDPPINPYSLAFWKAFRGSACDLGSFGEEIDNITDLHQIHEEFLLTEHSDGVAELIIVTIKPVRVSQAENLHICQKRI
nr:hypothetical protein [Tanacetum cinerariifolium]